MSRFRHVALVFLLLPLLLPILGFVPGPQTDSDEARRTASFVPEVAELLSRPTVRTSADYDPASDSWRVVLTEEVSQTAVAELTVMDDTREVEGVEVYPVAETLTYPKTSKADAIKLALTDPEVGEELRKHGPYTADAEYEDGEWTVHFEVEESGSVGGMPVEDGERKEVAQVGVDDETWQLKYVWTGDQVGWQMARGDYGAYGKQANYWYVWGPLAFVFALAFWRTDKLFSVRNLDVVALLGFLVSHSFFRAGEVHWAVLLWYPPLLYLLGRTFLMGFGVGERVEKTSNLPTPVLFVLGALASGFVLALNLDSRVIDVGYASVAGADLAMNGTLPYGNMPSDVGTGDTYGPLNYLLYLPFRWLFGYSGEWDYLPAAHAMTAFAFVATALALLFAGWRYAGTRGGAALLFAWAVFPYTLYSTNNNTNDVIMAAVVAIGLATVASPLARGMTVAAGFAIKLFTLILAPLWMLHDGRRRAPIVDFVLGGTGVVLLTFWVFALDGDPIGAAKHFYERTLAFQSSRETPWTIFIQVPELGFLQRPLTALAVFLAVLIPFVTKKRTVRRLAAFSAALIITFQITFNYWFYPYIIWFEPFVFLALLPATNEKTALDREDNVGRPEERPASEQKDAQREPSGQG
ncbi:MAG TPA: glycosyltransferase family 87 protein [Rubrobacteraceae bacterium]|nr:glycosyltransferase family 87 protein [Rubrobacteraceae bacterium]